MVEAPYEMSRDRPEIIGKLVALTIEGVTTTCRVKGVERHLPSRSIACGEKIALWVEETDTPPTKTVEEGL